MSLKWKLGPIMPESEAMMLPKMTRDYNFDKTYVGMYHLDNQKIILQSGIALMLIGKKEDMKSWLFSPQFSMIVGRGSGTGLACTGYHAHAGVKQAAKLGAAVVNTAIKHPSRFFDHIARATMRNQIEGTMESLCRLQVFQASAMQVLRDDLLFFREGDLAMEGPSLWKYVSDSGFLKMDKF